MMVITSDPNTISLTGKYYGKLVKIIASFGIKLDLHLSSTSATHWLNYLERVSYLSSLALFSSTVRHR